MGLIKEEFDPDQPRDEAGRWTSGGGSGGLASLAQRREGGAPRKEKGGQEPKVDKVDRLATPHGLTEKERHDEWLDRAKRDDEFFRQEGGRHTASEMLRKTLGLKPRD